MDFQVWYNELPFVTKNYMTIAFITTSIASFNLIGLRAMYLSFYLVFHEFEVLIFFFSIINSI